MKRLVKQSTMTVPKYDVEIEDKSDKAIFEAHHAKLREYLVEKFAEHQKTLQEISVLEKEKSLTKEETKQLEQYEKKRDEYERRRDEKDNCPGFEKSIGDQVVSYEFRLRYHTDDGCDASDAGHMSFDYRAIYSDGSSKWCSLSESSKTLSIFVGKSARYYGQDNYLEIPMGTYSSRDDIERIRMLIKENAFKKWEHAHWHGFAATCVDSARYALMKMLPGYPVSMKDNIPREFALTMLQTRLEQLENSLDRDEMSETDQQAYDLEVLECLKAFIEFMQTGKEAMYASKQQIYLRNFRKYLDGFPPNVRDNYVGGVEVDYSLREGVYDKISSTECPYLEKELYDLHRLLVHEYIPYCRSDKYSPQDMMEKLQQISKFLCASDSHDSPKKHEDSGMFDYVAGKAKEVKKSLRSKIYTFLFYLMRKILTNKIRRRIQRGTGLEQAKECYACGAKNPKKTQSWRRHGSREDVSLKKSKSAPEL